MLPPLTPDSKRFSREECHFLRPERASGAICTMRASGPEVLDFGEIETSVQTGPAEVLVKVEAAGVNFIDTHRRSSVDPMVHPPVAWHEGPGSYATQVVKSDFLCARKRLSVAPMHAIGADDVVVYVECIDITA